MRHPLCFTDHRDHHVRLLRGSNRFINHRLRRTRVNFHRFFILVEEIDNPFVISGICTFGVQHFALARHHVFDTAQHRHRLPGDTCGRPTAHHVTLAIRQRADDGHGGIFLQRQRFLTVFQQHQTLTRDFTRFRTVQTAFSVGVLRV